MSNALAIATVTETLVQVLQSALTGINLGSSPHVTNTRPDQQAGLPTVGVNVFLYQIAPNPYLRNTDLPTRKADGSLLQRPKAAVDLYYLLSFYGDDSTLEQQRLLGAVVRELHAHPTLTRSMIAAVQQNTAFLQGANLDQQPELVRFTPVAFSLEELSKLWSFLLKTDYVLSTAYVGSVVLIETDDPVPPPPLPVLKPKIYVLPFRQPVITQILSAEGTDLPILPGSEIVLLGRNLVLDQPGGGSTRVMIRGVAQDPIVASDTRIVVALPPGLPAGVQPVQVIQSLMLGEPPLPHRRGFQSDVATFVLHPVIQKIGSPPAYAIAVQTGVGSPPGNALTVRVNPTVAKGQRALLELLQLVQPTAARLFDAGVVNADIDTLIFPLHGLPAGNYLVRVRIDGAESPLDLDPSGAPVAPSIAL
jgi:Pvc16 N-terminal domain